MKINSSLHRILVVVFGVAAALCVVFSFLTLVTYLDSKGLADSNASLVDTLTNSCICFVVFLILGIISIFPSIKWFSLASMVIFIIISIFQTIILGMIFPKKETIINNYQKNFYDDDYLSFGAQIQKINHCCGWDDPLIPSEQTTCETSSVSCKSIIEDIYNQKSKTLFAVLFIAILCNTYCAIGSGLIFYSMSKPQLSQFDEYLTQPETI